MSSPPAFQLYASDFYMDTASWSPNDVGIYFRLLIWEWINGPLPDDLRKMSRIAGCDPKTLDTSWRTCLGEKFIKKGYGHGEISRPMYQGKIPTTNGVGGWENSRLEQTRKEQQEHREKLVNSGRLGGLRTQEITRIKSSEASSENQALLSSSLKPSPKAPKIYSTDFLKFYYGYPKRVGRKAAWKAWKNLKGDIPQIDELMVAIEKQKQSNQWKKENGQYIPNPATWLNQGRWDDEVEIEVLDKIEQEYKEKYGHLPGQLA